MLVLVKCVLVLTINDSRIADQFIGTLMKHSGDSWTVDFTQSLSKFNVDDVTPYVKTINGNACLVISGKLPYAE